MAWFTLLACTATIQIYAPDDAQVYVSKGPVWNDHGPAFPSTPNPSARPGPPRGVRSTGDGKGDTVLSVYYFAWDRFYVWAGGPGYEPDIRVIPNVIKPGPLLVGACAYSPVLIWASGPSEAPLEMHPEAIESP